MPDVPYLLGGESPTHERMNTLFAEADRRTSLALDNHSILYLLQDRQIEALNFFPQYLGPTFTWATGTQPISGYWGTWSYDHNLFLSALAGAVQYAGTVSHPATVGNTVRIDPLPISYWSTMGRSKSTDRALLSRSLEAHKRPYEVSSGVFEDYWIDETYTIPPGGDTDGALATPIKLQRIRTYEQAELIFEGVTDLDFQARWNAFNFFRAHNLNGTPLTIRFRKTDGSIAHTLTVPAYGSRCLRRDRSDSGAAVDGIYTEGFNYWQRFIAKRPGYNFDARFYQHTGCNNISNPSILIPFINHVLAGQQFFNGYDQNNPGLRRFAAPTVMLDPHVRAPLPSSYTTGPAPLYGNPTVDATLLGDCLHHRGDLIDARTSPSNPNVVTTALYTFTGYAGLLTGGNGLTVLQTGDDLKIKSSESSVTHDLISLSSNLICTGEGNHIQYPVRDGTAFITLDRHNPPRNISPVDRVTNSAVVSYNLVGAGATLGAAVNQTINREFLQLKPDNAGAPSPSAGGYILHRDTIADVKTLAKLSNPAYPNPSNAFSTFTVEVELSAGGLVVKSTQTIPLIAPFSNPNQSNFADDLWAEPNLAHFLSQSVIPVLGVNTRHHITTDGDSIVIKRATVFTGYGFPDTDNWSYTGFFSPRRTRVYRDRRKTGIPIIAQGHADFDEDRNADGYEMKYMGTRGSLLRTSIAVLSPWNAPNAYLGLGGSGTGPNQVAGTMSNNDVLYAAVNNVTVPGYWSGNRARILQNLIYRNDPNDGSDFTSFLGSPIAAQMYRYLWMELLVEHYNNLAAKVNSISRYKPLNWADHGVIQIGSDQTTRHRLAPNDWAITDEVTTNVFGFANPWWSTLTAAQRTAWTTRVSQYAGIKPAEQYAAFRLHTSDPGYLAAQAAGIPISTILDLPDNFSALRATRARSVRLQANPNVVATQTENPSLPVRGDLNGMVNYHWVKSSDVQTYAESKGYKYAYKPAGVLFDLRVFNMDDWTFTRSRTGNAEAQPDPSHSRLMDFVPDGTAWICTRGPFQIQAMDWADTFPGLVGFAGSQAAGVFYCNNIPERFRRVHYSTETIIPNFSATLSTARNPAEYTTDKIGRAMGFAGGVSGGVPDNVRMIEISVPWLKFTPGFSQTNASAAEFHRQFYASTVPTRILPFTVEPTGASRVIVWSDFTSPV